MKSVTIGIAGLFLGGCFPASLRYSEVDEGIALLPEAANRCVFMIPADFRAGEFEKDGDMLKFRWVRVGEGPLDFWDNPNVSVGIVKREPDPKFETRAIFEDEHLVRHNFWETVGEVRVERAEIRQKRGRTIHSLKVHWRGHTLFLGSNSVNIQWKDWVEPCGFEYVADG